MEQARNVLILKGNVPAEKVLDLLDDLLSRITGRNGHTPKPWQLFSPLAMLLGCLKKSTADCRKILSLIQKDKSCLDAVLSSYTTFARFSNLRNEIEKLIVKPCLVESQNDAQEEPCHTFIWKPHKAGQESKHITANDYDLEKKNPKGLISKGHNRKIYVSIRPPAANHEEARSEREETVPMEPTKESQGFFQHFAFVVDASDPDNSFDWGMLDAAADELSGWLEFHQSY
ncbi:hypothetical protein PMIN04_007918 [Paraphaeosphaeria minitans]|uniref:Uncharacterized protein n=1 Tax=Paraphaeosphaeria minitans TaxID=565426 RepID=A0A9P6G7P7_9PLEO|nr:hypothetical protein PMIN01_12074 [Paraphaeosphaeria minitans]